MQKKLETDCVLNKNIFVIPIGNHLYKIGSTFLWDDMEENVTDAEEKKCCRNSKNFKRCIYNSRRKAAIRPAMRDRRPVVGRHPEYKKLICI